MLKSRYIQTPPTHHSMTPNSQNKRKGRKQKGGKDRRKYIAKAVTYIAYENVRKKQEERDIYCLHK